MNSLITTMIVWLLLSAQPQKLSIVERQLSFEKRAVAEVQWMAASELDAELPSLSLTEWLAKVFGPGAGVAWQLSDCGDYRITAPNDVPACVETSAILPDRRLVVLRIIVGTFKKGRFGTPTFCFGAIEQNGELHLVRRLRDLPSLLWTPGILKKRFTVKLPELNIPEVKLAANNANIVVAPAWNGEEIGLLVTLEEPPPSEPPPQKPPPPKASPQKPPLRGEGKPGGDVINEVQPRYPAIARKLKVSGQVKVEITISEDGRVIEAKAINGHPLLRAAAEEAARQWIFRPAPSNSAPVETQRVLMFVFQ